MQMAATATARTQPPPTYHVYLTKYSYDPVQYSPNDNPDMELPLTAGEYLFIYGDMDEDGFYEGELLDGRRGLVPSNFVERVPAEELEDFRQLPPSYCNGGTSSSATNRANGTAAKTQTTDGGSTTSTTSARVRNATTPPELTSSTTAASNGSLGREQSAATAAAGARSVTITEIIDNIDVSPPANLRLERQLSTSFIIAWEAPADIPSDQIVCYNVYSNELFLTTVKGNDRCKALLEKLDPNKKHQISVRTVTSKGQSKDHLCAITIGGDEPTSLTPTGLRVTEVSTKSAVVSWFPAESGLHHVITVNKHNRTVIRPGCCRCLVNGLTPDAEHTVHISALDPQTQTPSTPESVTFLTLSEDLPDAPVDVQVEVGPQRGTLLVTWMPALRHKHAGSVAAGSGPESVDRIAITGYVVYVDGTKVKQLDSPSGDHVLLDSRSFASFPADPKLVTVRTAAAGDRESRDSRPAMLSDQMLEEIRTGMMLKEVELNPVGTSAVGGSRNTSDSTGSSPVDQIPSMDAGSADGYRSRDGYKLRYGSRLHPRAVPHIEITRDAMSGGSSGADDSDGSSTRHRTPGGTRRRSKQTEDGRVEPTGSRQYGSTEDPADRLSRHRTRQPVQQPADWTSPAGSRIRNRGAPDPVGADFFNSDPEAVDDSLIGADSDLEFGPSSASCHAYPSVSSRSHAHFHAHRRGHQSQRSGSNYRLFIALFDYDPSTMSPNPGAIEEELPFLEGQLIKIHGDKDADGFYLGEMDGRRGLVPCNMVSEVHVDSPDIAERWLRENSPTPPPGYSGPRKAGSRTAAGPSSPRSAHTRSHRPMEYDQRRRPSDRPLMGPGPPLPPGAVPRHRLPAARKMVAIYDYDPRELSPNVDVEQELSFKMGDVIIVYGDPDYDGFYRGKLGSRRGLVPSNFLRPAPPSSSSPAVVPPVRHGPPGPSQQPEYHHQQQQHLPPDVASISDPTLQITPHAGTGSGMNTMMMMESRDIQHQQPPNLDASMSAVPQQQMTATNQQSAVRSRADPNLDQLQQQQPENGGASSSIRQNYVSGAMPAARMSGPTIAGVGMTDVESTQMKQRRMRDPASVY